jgi:hypothetical protein
VVAVATRRVAATAMAPAMTAGPASAWEATVVAVATRRVAAMAMAPAMTAGPALAWEATAKPEGNTSGLFSTYNRAALRNAALFFIPAH